MVSVLGLMGVTLAKPALRFLVTNNEMLENLSQGILDDTVTDLIKDGEGKLSGWFNSFERRFNKAVRDSLKKYCEDDREVAHIAGNMEILFRKLKEKPLRPMVFYSQETLYDELKKQAGNLNDNSFDKEESKFNRVLWEITPLLLKEKENESSYVSELLQECLKSILKIQQGTEILGQKFEELWEILVEERIKAESPEQKFYRLWERSQRAYTNADDNALNIHEEFLAFLHEKINSGTFDELCVSLPDMNEGITVPLAEYMCTGSKDRLPLFYAQVLVWLAQACVSRNSRDGNRKLIDSFLIQKRLEQAERIIEVSIADNSIDAEENKKCTRFCKKLNYEIQETKTELTDAEQTWIGQAPAVKVNRNNDALAIFEPVFYGGFDSVAGQDAKKMSDLELNIFQLAASGKTILLRGPQIIDNRNMLRLLHTPGFEMLCRMGIVAFSSYGNIKNTNDFIKSRLQNQSFKFSSFPEYDQKGKGASLRKIVLDGLERCLTFREIEGSIPQEDREQMEYIYDGYWIANECFQESDTLKYHQNRVLRTSRFNLLARDSNMLSYGLPDVLHNKLEELAEDQRLVPVEGRDGYLRCFAKLEQIAQKPGANGQCCKHRSDYDHMIDRLKGKGEFDEATLELFRRLVHSRYLFYNGKLSCEKVILPMSDRELCIHHKNQELQKSIFKVDYAYKRYKRMSAAGQNVIGWGNILKCVLDARDVMADSSISTEKKALMMNQATGLAYTTTLDQLPNVTEMSIKTSEGEQLDVSDHRFDMGEACETDTQEYYQTPVEASA